MRQVGKYIVEDVPLGSGGMGRVLKGAAPEGFPVAIKEILPIFVSDVEYRARIESEINFLKKLNNPNVVKVYDHFEQDGNLYIVMELVEGHNIEQYVGINGPIPWQDAARYMVKLLETMQDVHEHGIVHRDIKPGNIMIRPNGEICLLDFGVAKDVSNNNRSGGTVVGTIIGTDGYMSPEQSQGLSIDHRSDVYALGCVLYFMLTGKHAFGSTGSELTMHKIITEGKFPKLSDSIKGLPSSLQTVLDHAVDKNMMRRYQSCREFASQLAKVMPGGTQINSANRTREISVSVGRENCDICIAPESLKVSRHHADITKRHFTGGEFFIFSDCSSNGTMINGQMLRKGMSYNIPVGQNPEILLAGDPSCRLDMAEVAEAFARKKAMMDAAEGAGAQSSASGSFDAHAGYSDSGFPPPPGPGYGPGPMPGSGPRRAPRPNSDSESFFGAVKTCFNKYATFSGRASRAEFWWFQLFNFIISAIVGMICGFMVAATYEPSYAFLSYIWAFAILLPSWAVCVRRLHDTNRSGWNLLLGLIPLVGGIILLVWFCQRGTEGPNKYGTPTNYNYYG